MGGNPSICDNPSCLCQNSEGIPTRDGGNMFPRLDGTLGHSAGTELVFDRVRDIRDNRDPSQVYEEMIEERSQKGNGKL